MMPYVVGEIHTLDKDRSVILGYEMNPFD